jgi:hypothetical protein
LGQAGGRPSKDFWRAAARVFVAESLSSADKGMRNLG